MLISEEIYDYVLFIDEAGDDGLHRVLPIDENGASEWLTIGGLLIRAENERKLVDWVKEVRYEINARQGPALHFRNLSPTKKRAACDTLAKMPVRDFCVCSNKKNMRGHRNERAATRGGKQWFYNYCVRLLMERVTDFCLLDAIKRHGEPRFLRVVFSERGGHSYGQTTAYWEVLKNQSSAGTTFLAKREIKHQVLSFRLVDYVPHTQNAGLQLADVIASAFFQAANTLSAKWDTAPAKALEPRMAAERGLIADYGLVLQPSPPSAATLTDNQEIIFRHYGYAI
ncbi:DUF3800 domain-containing protein [Pikeienuella piscinae]|uniref:DUF3800 domain-containing protein n=1 Tax=Pikeienuella piscinae TaxID=2748098 RepID=A0A7L5C057_9RHOB|nr:DUF3800 domain-containing protein [Pikeienuella piscinae]QIE55896.1 DUF3800 domain-containing protein [Pikeienuella piscinae]